ncbi:uncharacterized protein SPSK_03745 [Sporothrix schenckii 1099-18]|uniref:Uncharacterized protein n=1 Tax=Sporothrix schenckii 1099-18 TaxID=1397361 RepID=A0A0F2M1W2_SPOSC|nr:uncharacterized protein SPSK_03745 [Sporothrix schenckii 1099-18]KJR82750.1 hypothetical protein SPSK_03745 [Sporothrix schenckii 1099-18]
MARANDRSARYRKAKKWKANRKVGEATTHDTTVTESDHNHIETLMLVKAQRPDGLDIRFGGGGLRVPVTSRPSCGILTMRDMWHEEISSNKKNDIKLNTREKNVK